MSFVRNLFIKSFRNVRKGKEKSGFYMLSNGDLSAIATYSLKKAIIQGTG